MQRRSKRIEAMTEADKACLRKQGLRQEKLRRARLESVECLCDYVIQSTLSLRSQKRAQIVTTRHDDQIQHFRFLSRFVKIIVFESEVFN